ncbi:MAG: MBL fold metallo-hydrolase [Pseudolabrys sp.]|jgi:glyoxylase-like metal-dependent hydrolase (beta-lactamase superfamily II)
MSGTKIAGLAAMIAVAFVTTAQAQTTPPPAPPPYATTKVEGTDNVYIFRYGGYLSMFIVTKAGVIVADPISLRRPAQVYIDEIRKVTQAPIKYMIYSHSHFDHIAGGKPFKDLGATVIAHKNAKKRILEVKSPDVVVPDEVVDQKKVITLGGTTLELLYVGKNHSDSTLVMRLPKEKIIYTVDWIPLESLPFRVMADNYLPDFKEGLKKVIAMDWDRLIPGHPGRGGRMIGTKDDVRAQLSYHEDVEAAVKKAISEGKNYDIAEKEIKLPKYEQWGNYGAYLQGNIERYYDYINRGI